MTRRVARRFDVRSVTGPETKIGMLPLRCAVQLLKKEHARLSQERLDVATRVKRASLETTNRYGEADESQAWKHASS
jgi:hypothetical protein